jgi:hypothetical protein
VTSGAPASYNGAMKRGMLCAAFAAAAVTSGGAAASPHHTVTRAEAVSRLGRLLGAKPQQVWRAWADVGTRSVKLEWRAYAPQARIRVMGGPAGVKVAPSYRGPAVAWLGVSGNGPVGVGSDRTKRRPVLPLRSTSIPLSLVSTLARDGAPVGLAPLRARPTIARVKAISKLRSWGRGGRLRGIWLVRFEHGTGRERLAWMAVTLHARVPILGCTKGKKCPPFSTSPLASFLDAHSGKQIEALTVNGWTPRLPPTASSHARPSLSADLRLTRHFACLDGNRHRVERRTLEHFHAVTAVYCSSGLRTYPGRGQWEVLVRKVAVGSVAGLQRYYERPDEPNKPRKGVLCSDVRIVVSVPSFADAHGRWVTPARWPEDRCGQPLGSPPTVRWHVVRVRRLRQLVSAAALAANCPMKVGNTAAWAGPPHDARAGDALFERTPRTVHVCVYRTPPDHFAVGDFVRGFRLDAARTRRLLEALDGAGPKRGCPKQRTFADVDAGPGLGLSVELGGCYRVERPDRLAGTANPAVVRAILAGLRLR